ncbi:MAG TPA: TonB-dependent receptor [Candidatus Baltobacteraceae bacterium]|nr:TonB-dependent receptor [Candidatus Baltobacteraceae bacterium]
MRRTLTSALVFLFVSISLAAAPAMSSAQTASSTARVSGMVDDESGAPISGASVVLKGPQTRSTASDARGAFTFADVPAGSYVLSVTKGGYTAAVQNDIIVLGGQTLNVAVRMAAATFSSLRTIASVRTSAHALNTSAASVNVVTTSTFIDQAQPQVTRVLSQVPGVQISFPSNSANAAAPGAITVPNIRDATSYETASLIDGHPISVGQYGDNVTTFLNPFMFGSMEVVKGPGADAPEVNNAIGGTTNFRTKDPSLAPYSQLLFGFDNRGGTISNFEYSDTVGKLGFVMDLATNNNPSALFNKQVYYDPAQNSGIVNGATLGDAGPNNPVGNTNSTLPTTPQLLACCWTLEGSMDQTAELVKLRYKFSNATRLTLSYLGSQTTADQNGNTGNLYDAVFSPGPGYTGSLAAGSTIQYASLFPGARQGEFNNEPIYQAEISTAVGNDSVVARYYNATVSRYQFGGTSPSGFDFNNVTLYGTSSGDPSQGFLNGTFNGSKQLVQYWDYYTEPELDKLQGESFQYQHPIANNGLLTFSGDWTASQSTDYTIFSIPGVPQIYSFSLPPGTHQELGTYLLRGQFYFGSKLSVTLANYFNTYSSTYATNCPLDQFGFCTQAATVNGTGVTFATTKNTHDDPRLGLVYRPSASSSVRFSLGSSIAPPFLGLLTQITSTPVFDATSGVAIESQSNGNLKPETGFGYDLGGDLRLRDQQTLVSGDVYLTNLYNRFFGQTVNTGLTCAQVACQGSTSSSVPVLNQTNTNISNARFEGVELSLQRDPAVGFGFDLSGALNRGYYYDLPPYFYCSLGASQPGGCVPANYDQNLNVIAGQNTNGIPVGFYGVSYNGNMRIPYSQGNAEISYRTANQIYASFGETYYGKNNSLNRPPFFIGYATLRVPVSKSLALQLSGDNIFNAYPGILPVWGAGVPITVASGGTAATNGNVLGPATWRLVLSTRP